MEALVQVLGLRMAAYGKAATNDEWIQMPTLAKLSSWNRKHTLIFGRAVVISSVVLASLWHCGHAAALLCEAALCGQAGVVPVCYLSLAAGISPPFHTLRLPKVTQMKWRSSIPGGIGGRKGKLMHGGTCLPLMAPRRIDGCRSSHHHKPCCHDDEYVYGLHLSTSKKIAFPLLATLIFLFRGLLQPVVALNTYDRLYARGGRSFSVIDPETMTVVWDSGDAFEANISSLTASYFNSRGFTEEEYKIQLQHRIENQTNVPIRQDWLADFRAGTVDSMSTNLGCQPRALVMGMMNGHKDRFLFVALINPSGIMVYNFTDPLAPVFKSWEKLPVQHLEPEAMHFTAADDSDAPYLYVICGFSASLLVYAVDADGGLAIAASYDGTAGKDPVPFGARLVNGLTTYSALGYIPEEDSIYDVPIVVVANKFARRVDVFLVNMTDALGSKIQRLGAISLSSGIAEGNSTERLFRPGFPSDVYVQGSVLAITVVPYDPAVNPSLPVDEQGVLSSGSILFFQLKVEGTSPFKFLGAAATGAWPKKIVFAGSRFLVADYAKWAPIDRGADHIDPPGGVTEIRLPSNVYTLVGAMQEMNTISNDFSSYAVHLQFDSLILDEEIELPGTGLVASDPQPIDIAFSNNSNIAYVLLRSSNAIAKLNVTTMQFMSVHWLGAKNYSSSVRIDPSSKDGGPNLRNFTNLFGLYMPSRMKVIPAFPGLGNREYIITVNEGEDTTMRGGNVTVKDLDLDNGTFPNAEELKSPANLGDLRVVRWKGLKSQVHTQLYNGLTRTAETECDNYSYFQFDVSASQVCMDMRVKLLAMQGTPDIYVSKGAAINPEIYDLTWANYEPTSDNVENFVITHLDPEFEPGTYYFGVYAYCQPTLRQAAMYNITVSLEEPASGGGNDPANNDLLALPAFNRQPRVDGLSYYSFCVSHPCSPITVNISDCRAGANYCPEVLVSTSVLRPTAEDYTWKTTGGRRAVTIAPSDPYNKAGVFYVGVFSRCTDSDPSKCGTPSPDSAYNLTVSYNATSPIECPEKPKKVVISPWPVTLEENVVVNQSTTCGGYSYYSVKVDNPCNDLVIEAVPSCPTCGVPRIYVSKDYVSSPTDADRTWTSAESAGKSSVTVSAFDRDFSSVGMFFVGVRADCAAATPGGSSPVSTATYSIVARFSTSHVYRWQNVTSLDMMNKMIFNQPVSSPLGYDYYHFCVGNFSNGDVVVELINCVTPSLCPDTYWWPEMLVSKSRWAPTVNDRAWRLAQLDRNNITLRATDPDVRPWGGHYFVGVYAWCNTDCNASLSSACAPCGNIPNSAYNLSVRQGASLLEMVAPVMETSPLQATASTASVLKKSAARVRFSTSSWKDLLWRIAIAGVVAALGVPRPFQLLA
ncbi:hypothetical protein CBR_g46848 [Chara braunii]|uniref:Uncharacterized protein n=1 Tax=Chara braunii TaxID=69332 RepID=A0A388M1C1_CHABU|nr:hypothetical protein CBR_g46848 [Chara braunii]|eukprot:GBG88282.1 hypothetical protein CBR_g46848 [Chara braunii]